MSMSNRCYKGNSMLFSSNSGPCEASNKSGKLTENGIATTTTTSSIGTRDWDPDDISEIHVNEIETTYKDYKKLRRDSVEKIIIYKCTLKHGQNGEPCKFETKYASQMDEHLDTFSSFKCIKCNFEIEDYRTFHYHLKDHKRIEQIQMSVSDIDGGLHYGPPPAKKIKQDHKCENFLQVVKSVNEIENESKSKRKNCSKSTIVNMATGEIIYTSVKAHPYNRLALFCFNDKDVLYEEYTNLRMNCYSMNERTMNYECNLKHSLELESDTCKFTSSTVSGINEHIDEKCSKLWCKVCTLHSNNFTTFIEHLEKEYMKVNIKPCPFTLKFD